MSTNARANIPSRSLLSVCKVMSLYKVGPSLSPSPLSFRVLSFVEQKLTLFLSPLSFHDPTALPSRLRLRVESLRFASNSHPRPPHRWRTKDGLARVSLLSFSRSSFFTCATLRRSTPLLSLSHSSFISTDGIELIRLSVRG